MLTHSQCQAVRNGWLAGLRYNEILAHARPSGQLAHMEVCFLLEELDRKLELAFEASGVPQHD